MMLRLAVSALLFSTMIGLAQTPASTVAAPTAPAITVPDDIEFLQDVEIGAGGGRPLHAYVFYPKAPQGKPMPGLILVHGGGWEKGTYREASGIEYAKAGYFVADIEYRLSGEAKWPAQIEDCKLAVRWLRANAAKYNVNPDRIGALGGSAGGHLVALLGTTADVKEFEGNGGYPGVSSRVMAVVDLMGPADFTAQGVGIGGSPAGQDSPLLSKLFGVKFADEPEVWKQASPIVHVSKDAAPFLIIHGDADLVVPYRQSIDFMAALQKAGVPVELITVKGGGHNLHSLPGQPPAEPGWVIWSVKVRAFLDQYLKK